jgi:hypothetical protein
MAETIRLPNEVRRGKAIQDGYSKGWRLVEPDGKQAFKADLIRTFSYGRYRFAILKVRSSGRQAALRAVATRKQRLESGTTVNGHGHPPRGG